MGRTALYKAAEKGHHRIVKLLAEHGADPDIADLEENAPIHIAARSGHKYATLRLIKAGADVNKPNVVGKTAMHLLSDDTDDNVIDELRKKGADINASDKEGWTPLYTAAYYGKIKLCDRLLKRGADVNQQELKGWSPLHAAADRGHLDICRLFVENYNAKINIQSDQGTTPLYHACANGITNVVEYLLRKGANPSKGAKDGHKPIHASCMYGHENITRTLVEQKADLDGNNLHNKGYAPLHYLIARKENPVNLITHLLDNGADINNKNSSGFTPLGLAAYYDKPDVVRLLVRRGANMNLANNKGRTPLQTAARYGYEDIAKYLARKMNIEPPQLAKAKLHLHRAEEPSKVPSPNELEQLKRREEKKRSRR